MVTEQDIQKGYKLIETNRYGVSTYVLLEDDVSKLPPYESEIGSSAKYTGKNGEFYLYQLTFNKVTNQQEWVKLG